MAGGIANPEDAADGVCAPVCRDGAPVVLLDSKGATVPVPACVFPTTRASHGQLGTIALTVDDVGFPDTGRHLPATTSAP